jgi:hypothetical protein
VRSILSADAILVTQAMTATTIAEVFVEEEAVTVELEIQAPPTGGALLELLQEERL